MEGSENVSVDGVVMEDIERLRFRDLTRDKGMSSESESEDKWMECLTEGREGVDLRGILEMSSSSESESVFEVEICFWARAKKTAEVVELGVEIGEVE